MADPIWCPKYIKNPNSNVIREFFLKIPNVKFELKTQKYKMVTEHGRQRFEK